MSSAHDCVGHEWHTHGVWAFVTHYQGLARSAVVVLVVVLVVVVVGKNARDDVPRMSVCHLFQKRAKALSVCG